MSSEKSSIDWSAVLADLEAKKTALEQSIAGIRLALNHGLLTSSGEILSAVGLATPQLPSNPGPPIDLPAGAFFNKSVPDAIKLYLSAARAKKTIREISNALRQGGMESTSGNFENVVTGSLHRLKMSGKVLKFKDGWGLAEWYPPGFRLSAASKNQKAQPVPQKKAATGSRQASGVPAKIKTLLSSNPATVFSAKAIAGLLHIDNQKAIKDTLARFTKEGKFERVAVGQYKYKVRLLGSSREGQDETTQS